MDADPTGGVKFTGVAQDSSLQHTSTLAVEDGGIDNDLGHQTITDDSSHQLPSSKAVNDEPTLDALQ